MKLNPSEKAQIKAYLDAVGANLVGPDRSETLAELESHIYEAIAASSGANGSSGVVEAVLSELEPPESYADTNPVEGSIRKLGLEGHATKTDICGLAISGAILLPFGLPVLWHVVRLTPAGDHWDDLQFYSSPLYYFLILPLGLIAMVISPILGAMSTKRIRQSKGSLTGGALGILDAVFYPILLFNLILFIVLTNVMDVQEIAVPMFIVFFMGLLVLFANALACRLVYMRCFK